MGNKESGVAIVANNERELLGISSQAEARRFREVAAAVGVEVAQQELEANRAAYFCEFVEDRPVSPPHFYYISGERLYSQPYPLELFAISSQIDPRERNGATIEGFLRVEKILVNSQNSHQIVCWYSPAGRAGTEIPFDKLYYDSGRLYLFLSIGDQTIQLDIKVDEARFPIYEFLINLNQYLENSLPVFYEREEMREYFLTHPLATEMSPKEFFNWWQQFLQEKKLLTKTAYVSRRRSLQPVPHTFGDILVEAYNQLGQRMTIIDTIPKANNKLEVYPPSPEDIRFSYLAIIEDYMRKNGQNKIELYGCSTTSVYTSSDLLDKLPFTASSLGTFWRLLGASNMELTNSGQLRIRCPRCKQEEVYRVAEIKREGEIRCCHCGNATRCWEPIVNAVLRGKQATNLN